MEIIFASSNSGKLAEIRKLMPVSFNLKGLKDLGFTGDIPETGQSFAENALIKARYVHERYQISCFADDSGLQVKALNGRPGVFSARYAGENASDEANREKLLKEMKGHQDRSACFVCCIALIFNNKEYLFEGTLEGQVSERAVGNAGFGYDPVFIPLGDTRTLAQFGSDEKNAISHRGRAMRQMIAFVNGISL